jgi:DNA repair exonuclease SbcCD ATPase subunit
MADIKTMQDLFKLQQEMKDRLGKKLASMAAGKSPVFDELAAEQAADLGRVKEALAHAVKERDSIVRHWDDRIDRLRARVDKLAKERKQADELIQRAKKEGTTKEDTPKKAPAKKRPPSE